MDKLVLEELSKTLSSYKIAEKLGTSPTNVRYWLNKYGLNSHQKEKLFFTCTNCGIEKPKSKNTHNKYCSNKCQGIHKKQVYIDKWKQGLISGCIVGCELSETVRDYILKKFNYSCTQCGWNERHPLDNRPLVEVNHIDGKSSNCVESNLEVLCKNCHSKTLNYGSRNKDSDRKKYRLRA